jgi:hypothetical protein
MRITIDAVYDGEALRPEGPVDLRPHTRYRLIIEDAVDPEPSGGPPEAVSHILARAEDLGVSDLAEQHDHYLYGTPKQ